MELIKIIIVTWNRPQLLKNCLESLIKEVNGLNYELLIILNGSDNKTLTYLETLNNSHITHVSISKTTPAGARNIGLSHCLKSNEKPSDFILFFDDDLIIPKGYFSIALEVLESNPNTIVMGGPDRKGPWSKGMEKSFNYALESPLTSGPTFYRHISKSQKVSPGNENNLILCNLWIKTKVFKDLKFKFDPSFVRNEETDILKRIRVKRGEILHISSLFVYHKRKQEISNIAKTYFTSGLHRTKLYLKGPNLKDLTFLLPAILFLSFLSWPLLMMKSLSIYFGLSLFWFFKFQGGKNDLIKFPQIFMIQLTILISYAVGTFYYPIYRALKYSLFYQKAKV